MRNFILIFSVIFIFVSCSVFTDIMIEKHFTSFAQDIDGISTEEDLMNITEKWEKMSEFAEIIIDHGDLEEVSHHLWAMKEEMKYDYDEFMESKALTKEMLLHIRDRNTLGIINIL